jgi:DNA-binding XRE family transcriptional regulator
MEHDIFIKKLGKSITKMREKNKLSQSDLARLMDLPRQNIYKLETGTMNPKAHTIYMLAKVMGESVGDLMNF